MGRQLRRSPLALGINSVLRDEFRAAGPFPRLTRSLTMTQLSQGVTWEATSSKVMSPSGRLKPPAAFLAAPLVVGGFGVSPDISAIFADCTKPFVKKPSYRAWRGAEKVVGRGPKGGEKGGATWLLLVS